MEKKRDPFLFEERRLWLFRLLSGAPRTEKDVRDRLAARGVAAEDADALIAECRELRLLDDALYARLFAEGHECWGSDRIACELSRRGVSREDIRSALEDRDEEAPARELAEEWLSRGFDVKRVAGRLRRRGFSGRTIRAVTRGDDETPW